jgi:hypothetical protein
LIAYEFVIKPILVRVCEEIQDIVITANLTPRKCLGFKTPFQAILKGLALESRDIPLPGRKAQSWGIGTRRLPSVKRTNARARTNSSLVICSSGL